ncbi:Rho guanine nucleotide exchange factor gef2, partial [Diplogelasinospora grovesii]
MVQAENTAEVIQTLQSALQTQHISNVDIDLVLPPGSIIPLQAADLEEVPEDEDDIIDPTLRQYGMYTPLVKLFGEPVFLPTSRLRRAPSRPTSLNRSKSFTKNQKVELRMKMGELVDTEERYVLKMNELVRHIADEFRQKARQRPPGSISPTEEDLEKLFPKSADQILQMNTAFMQELRKVMDDTEEDAMRDMELPFPAPRLGGSNRVKDPSGALAMARLFLEWFPKFTDCYQDYIRASQHFPQLLNSFLNQESSFRQRVAQKGEQTIRSILIEPVQRLPRYSLFIDQIVGCLPITHPALQLMLRARDIITNICSMDDPLPDKPHVTTRLRAMVECWPLDLEPQGRLILAADFVELAPPYFAGASSGDMQDRAGLFLLFADCIVILKKKSKPGLTARDFLRELDKPSAAGLLASMTNVAGGPGSWEFAFTGWHTLADVRFTESADGQLVWMTSTQEMKGAHAGEYFTSRAITSRCFLLQESYAGKAGRWSEDIVRARIEGRFPEAERENPTWTLRTVKMEDNNFGLHAAVFQEAAEQLIEGRREPASIRIVLDNDKGTKGAPVGHYGVEVVVEVRSGDMSRLSMSTLGLNGKKFTDEIALEDLLATLTRRVIQVLSTQFNVGNLRLVPALVSYYTKILRGITITSKTEKNNRSFLASSPVKMLSSFLAGATASNATDTATSIPKHQRTPLGNVGTLFPASIPRSNSQKDLTVMSASFGNRDGPRSGMDENRPENPLVRLEQTFTGYVASLQARKGYFIGRALLNRSMVDETAINDLYNRLIESPFDLDASAELSAEVIFATFEKFVRRAWRDQMGPIMTTQALDALQARASRRVPGDFADFVRFLFGDMAPQNRRAFTALIKLLADLLDGCGNDGDRGALTLAFAELLVDDGSAPNYINLLDRLVEDCDRIFDDTSFGASTSLRGSAYDSVNSAQPGHKSKTPSITSQTSSLRRKFGFDTLLRQNSRNDSDRPSMWRSLSKHGRNPASGDSPSLSKASASSVNRSRSVDMGIQGPGVPNKLRRPGSRDRPPVAGAFDDIQHRPTSSHRLETIGDLPEVEVAESKSLKKKRRSSLSDLKALMAAASLEDPPLMPLRINKQQTAEKFNSAPRIPSPSRIPVSPPSQAQLQQQVLRTSRQKENGDPFQSSSGFQSPEAPKSSGRGHGKTLSTSQIPTLKPPSRIPTGSENSPTRPQTSPTKMSSSNNSKLRLQSPQKLRERLQVEKKAVDEVDASLKSELSRIAEDMARVNSALPRSATTDLRKLSAAVKALEERVPQVMQELQERQADMQREMEATLKATEQKVKSIDQLYKEATAENELLYEKFNSELGKIVKALKGKGREDKEELVAKLKESSEETARTKKENARLRREMVSLRTALKGGD